MIGKDEDFHFSEEEENFEIEGEEGGESQEHREPQEPEEWQDEKALRKALKKAERKQKSSFSRTLLLLLLLSVLVGSAIYIYLGIPRLEPPPPPPPKVVKKQPIVVPPPSPSAAKPEEIQPAEETTAPVAEETGTEIATPTTAPVAEPVREQEPEPSEQATTNEPEEDLAAVPETAAIEGEKGNVTYSVRAGAFLLKANLVLTLDTIERMGFEPKVIEGSKITTMTRLRLGLFSPQEAEARMEELSRVTSGVFSLPEEGGVAVYAGSYYDLDKARVLADRLYQQGVRLEEETVELEIPLYQVSFGEFSDLEEARQATIRAQQAGLDVYVVKKAD